MKLAVIAGCVLFVSGCSFASPLDIIIPTPKDSTTEEFLGNDLPDASVMPYHTLADIKAVKESIDLKLGVYKAQGELAKRKSGFISDIYSNLSDGIWMLLMAFLTTIGWLSPSPSEKHKVEAALYKQPPS